MCVTCYLPAIFITVGMSEICFCFLLMFAKTTVYAGVVHNGITICRFPLDVILLLYVCCINYSPTLLILIPTHDITL